MDLGLRGKVAVVTGAGRGVGREIALALAREGAHVAVNYFKSQRGADEVVAECRKLGVKAQAYGADVSDSKAAKELGRDGGRKGKGDGGGPWWGQSSRMIRTRRSRSRRSAAGRAPISRLNDPLATAISCPISTSLSRSSPATPRLSLSRKSPASSTN